MDRSKFKNNLFTIKESDFDSKALELFHYQVKENLVYRKYVEALGIDVSRIRTIEAIPFLPIQFFKYHKILCNGINETVIFESSGTTSNTTSKHYVSDPEFYLKNTVQIFERLYFPIKDAIVVGLLPSYLERNGSSLVYMVDHFISKSQHELSGFYLNQMTELLHTLELARNTDCKVLLIGVSFALMDLAEKHSIDLSNVTVMETGGMKGRRQEVTRDELHGALKKAFSSEQIHSEYGMTELLSQAYARKDGVFEAPPWMKVSLRPVSDPFGTVNKRKGILKIIDLANVDSCAFIETQDLGELQEEGSFKVLGRIDASDTRGCNLMID